jgi:hypothetical protein
MFVKSRLSQIPRSTSAINLSQASLTVSGAGFSLSLPSASHWRTRSCTRCQSRKRSDWHISTNTQECPPRIAHLLSGIGSGVIRANPISRLVNYARVLGQETDIAAKPFVGVGDRFTGVQVSLSSRPGCCHSPFIIRKPLLINVLRRAHEPFTGY